mgnify:CR=1 FL=1
MSKNDVNMAKKPFEEPEVESEKMYEVSQTCGKCQTGPENLGVQCQIGNLS